MDFKATHIIKRTGVEVMLYEPFPNDNGSICVVTENERHCYCEPNELEVIK